MLKMEEVLPDTLPMERIPGTEIMRDVGKIHFVHGPKSHQVLIPQPSGNADDPLNWTLTWKYITIGVQIIYTWITVASALSMAPMFPLLQEEWNLSQTQLNLITGSCVLALGYANFIIVPISNIFGRRFTCIVMAMLGAGSCVWEARAGSYSVLIGARIVNGIATATSETLMVQVICDVFFLHERGVWMGVYFCTYFLGLFVGPIISGAIASVHGWRSFFWLSFALSVLNILSLILFFPETRHHRTNQLPTIVAMSTVSPKDETDKPTSIHDEIEHSASPNIIGTGRPTKSQFKLISRPDARWKSLIFKDIIFSGKAFFFPIILWAGITVGGFANLLLFWNITESEVLGAPPFNFSVSAVGYSNFAFMVGGLVGLATGGTVSDWIAQRATVRNNGVRQAEMRLPALIPYFFLTIIAVTIGGLAEKDSWSWPVLVVVGYGISGMCITATPAIAIAYAVDCYKPIAGEIMVVATVIKNTCGFGMSYWVPQITASHGIIVPTMIQLALTAGPLLLALPLWFWGQKLRRLTRNSGVHKLEEEF